MTDEEQVWDGDGVDPWLPARLASSAEIIAAEQAVYRAYWAALSAWLVQVERAVIVPGLPPQAAAVFAQAPAWAQEVRRVADGPIRDVMGQAYATTLGPGYRFDSRPAVAAHLAEVVNRMVRTPDEVFDRVAAQIAKGSGLGEDMPTLARRVSTVLDATDTQTWPNRAVTVARTETLSALNAGRQDAFAAVADELGEPFEHMWLSTKGPATRPTHRRADGQRVPVGEAFVVGGFQVRYPGDPFAPGKERINCRCTTLLLRPGENVDLTDRQMLRR